LRKAEAAASKVDYSLHAGISEWNIAAASEIIHCIEKEGITSFKTYLAYRESIGISYARLRSVMEIVGPAGGTVLVHCEDGDIVRGLQKSFLQQGKQKASFHALSHPPEAEIRAVDKVIELSALTGCPVYIVHTSTAGAAKAIFSAKRSGLKVYGETCIQYLMLDDSVYDDSLDNIKVLPYVISPPLRSKKDQGMLWKGLADGTFDTVATDHCPFNLFGQKDLGLNDFTKIPNGAGGIEHRLSLLYTYGVLTGKITLNQFVDLTSTRAAGIFGFGNRKGKLQPGFDADIVIWNPEVKGIISADNHFQHCDSDIYENFPVQGKPEIVLVNGTIAFRNGKLETEELNGRFIDR
jgi:dihydropyrimidinase